jgi:hypothetical protein
MLHQIVEPQRSLKQVPGVLGGGARFQVVNGMEQMTLLILFLLGAALRAPLHHQGGWCSSSTRFCAAG